MTTTQPTPTPSTTHEGPSHGTSLPEAAGPGRSIRWRPALRSIRRLVADSERTEEVFQLIDALSPRSGDRLLARFRADPHGRALLAERPCLRVTLANRERLRALPEDSVGRAYARFMDDADLSAEGLVEASRHSEPDRSETVDEHGTSEDASTWLGERLRDSHDLWHVLTGYEMDEAGEVSLLAFTWAQTGNRGIGLIVLVGGAIGCTMGGLGWARYLRKAYQRGAAAHRLQFAPWEQWLERPIVDVRRALSIEPPEEAHPGGIVVANRGEAPRTADTAAT